MTIESTARSFDEKAAHLYGQIAVPSLRFPFAVEFHSKHTRPGRSRPGRIGHLDPFERTTCRSCSARPCTCTRHSLRQTCTHRLSGPDLFPAHTDRELHRSDRLSNRYHRHRTRRGRRRNRRRSRTPLQLPSRRSRPQYNASRYSQPDWCPRVHLPFHCSRTGCSGSPSAVRCSRQHTSGSLRPARMCRFHRQDSDRSDNPRRKWCKPHPTRKCRCRRRVRRYHSREG